MVEAGAVVSSRYLIDTQRHLICEPYSVANLHAMAGRLGIKRAWFHGGKRPHYDVPKGRYDEVRAKAVLVPARDILRVIDEALDGGRGTELAGG